MTLLLMTSLLAASLALIAGLMALRAIKAAQAKPLLLEARIKPGRRSRAR